MTIPLLHAIGPVATLSVRALTLGCSLDARAQMPRREPTPNDTLRSTEVAPDNRVTFRIYAPKASEVTLTGDWVAQGLGTAGALTKDDQGVWSLAVGPLPPDLYSYTFVVDGVRTGDPKNPLVKQGIGSLESMFLLPGQEAAYADTQAVPHGTIHQVWHTSATLGTQRRLHVYTPPGYEESGERLPVFCLPQGGGQLLNFGLKHLDTFGWIGAFSSAPNTKPAAELVPQAEGAAKRLRLLWLSCGDQDGLMNVSRELRGFLKQKQVPHTWHVDAGGHTWAVW